ncbi:MAG: hypothetical protein V1766_13135 [Pseudomonadota bacterium]
MAKTQEFTPSQEDVSLRDLRTTEVMEESRIVASALSLSEHGGETDAHSIALYWG